MGKKRENLLIGWVLVGFESCHCFRYSPSHPSPGIPTQCPSKDAVNMFLKVFGDSEAWNKCINQGNVDLWYLWLFMIWIYEWSVESGVDLVKTCQFYESSGTYVIYYIYTYIYIYIYTYTKMIIHIWRFPTSSILTVFSFLNHPAIPMTSWKAVRCIQMASLCRIMSRRKNGLVS